MNTNMISVVLHSFNVFIDEFQKKKEFFIPLYFQSEEN